MEYTFKTFQTLKFILIYFLLILVWFSGFIISGLFFHSSILFFSSFIGIPILFFLYRKKLFPSSFNTIIIDDTGFEFVEKSKKYSWNDLDSYIDLDNGEKGFYQKITLILKNRKKVYIVFFDLNKETNEWYKFKTDFFSMMRIKCTGIKSYYDSKLWNIVIYIIIAINLLFPFLLIFMKLKLISILGSWFLLIGASVSMIAYIRNNRSNAKTYKTYKEIQEEKQLNINKRE